jgi:hypothetical protein
VLEVQCIVCTAYPQPPRCTAAQGSAYSVTVLWSDSTSVEYVMSSVLVVQCIPSTTALHYYGT